MKKFFVLMLCIMLLLGAISGSSSYAAVSLTVDLSSIIGPVTHAAAGSLYGVIESKPDNNLIIPLRNKALNNPAVAGYQQPWGAAVPVAQRVAPMGTKVQIRLADWFTGWYDYTNLTDFFNKMTTTVNEVKASGITNVYGYEIWNEPDGTWHGQYVGQIDYSDSYVQFTVYVPSAKSYTMTVRYANGTGASSTHNLSVNGGTASTVTYANTGGWFRAGAAASLTRTVNLNAGNNTIRFTKGTGYAEIDFIDITGGNPVRYEAENATRNSCNIFNSGYASSNSTGNLTFSEFYSQSQIKLKQLDPSAKTIGPSYAGYTHAGMLEFMTYQKNNGTLPDYICWHQLGGENFNTNYNDYRAIETSLGISPTPITVNEYSGANWLNDEGRPGATVPLIAKFERLKIDSAQQSYWDVPNPGRLGTLLATDTQRNGGWWLYKWYGDMSGNMVNTTPPNVNDMTALDAFACVDSVKQYASIIFGGNTDGAANVVIKNFPSFFGTNGSKVHVRVDWTPFVNRSTVVNTTNTLLEGDYIISNNQIILPISGLYNNDGYRIYITPYGKATNRYEAEDAAVNRANTFSSSNASMGKYVGQIDYSDSYVDFYVKVPTTKAYTMTIRYANGTGANSTQGLAYNGGPWSSVTYAPTSGWAQFANLNVSVNLTAGDNIIRLAKGSIGYAEIDYIEIN